LVATDMEYVSDSFLFFKNKKEHLNIIYKDNFIHILIGKTQIKSFKHYDMENTLFNIEDVINEFFLNITSKQIKDIIK